MSQAWFYSDSQRQQQGPVADSYLFNAYQRGEVTLNTLVWREGMAQWAPLSHVAGELGITVASAAPPQMPPYAPRPATVVAPKSGNSGCLIIGVILLVGFLVVGGIIAAIAIPAYHDYVARSRVAQSLFQSTVLKGQVSAFFADSGRCPVNGDDGFNAPTDYASTEVQSINVGALDDGRCAIQIVFNDINASKTDGAELVFAMDQQMQWTHTSTLPDKFLPSSMRQ